MNAGLSLAVSVVFLIPPALKTLNHWFEDCCWWLSSSLCEKGLTTIICPCSLRAERVTSWGRRTVRTFWSWCKLWRESASQTISWPPPGRCWLPFCSWGISALPPMRYSNPCQLGIELFLLNIAVTSCDGAREIIRDWGWVWRLFSSLDMKLQTDLDKNNQRLLELE